MGGGKGSIVISNHTHCYRLSVCCDSCQSQITTVNGEHRVLVCGALPSPVPSCTSTLPLTYFCKKLLLSCVCSAAFLSATFCRNPSTSGL